MNPLILAWLQAMGGLLAAGLILRYLHGLRLRLREALQLWARGPGLKVRGRELVPRTPLSRLLVTLEEASFLVLGVGVAYLSVYYALSRFDATRSAAERLLHYAVDPLTQAGKAVLGYVPSAFFIVVIAGLLYLALQVLHLAFERIARGAIHFESFPADWALPTYKIVRFLVLVFGAVVIWPYLPGSESEAFKGISLFVGVLISLSSSSALANLIAGVILTYTRAFQPGDRIRVGQTEGVVTEKTLLITRLCNERNIVVTVPNAKLLSEPIQNFGGVSKQAPLMLSCSVTIGYNVPWRQVHALLLSALEGQADVLAQPEPKVWQRSLQDFSVHYELCFHTNSPRVLESTLSSVNAAIQDRFAQAGIEIMSPNYVARRDGSALTLPPSP
jgi:small-conductance mechanosensitive channel